MLRRLGTQLRLGISPAGVTLVRTGRRAGQAQVLAELAIVPAHGSAQDAIGATLHALLDAYDGPRLPLRLVLDDALVRHWMVTPPSNALRESDCRAAAALRFQTLYGEAPGDWHLAADWDARQPFLACAMPGALLASIRQAAAARGLPVQEIAPQFVVAWNFCRASIAPQAWFGLVGSGMLTLGVTRGRRLQALRATALPAAAWTDAPALARHLAREALRLDVPMPALLQLCGDLPRELPQRWSLASADGASDGPALECMRLDATSPLQASLHSTGAQLALTGAWT